MSKNTYGAGVPVGPGDPMANQDWRDQAACRGMDTKEFYPARGTYARVSIAVTTCGVCEVSGECLEFALRFNENGVWGGTSARERRAIRKERKSNIVKIKELNGKK